MEQLGTILLRTDDRARSHLHFEIRTFFTSTEVNGSAPRYAVNCGVECPPGPGAPVVRARRPALNGEASPGARSNSLSTERVGERRAN